eukprot:10305874-Karenia_brevis.AAC.1
MHSHHSASRTDGSGAMGCAGTRAGPRSFGPRADSRALQQGANVSVPASPRELDHAASGRGPSIG